MDKLKVSEEDEDEEMDEDNEEEDEEEEQEDAALEDVKDLYEDEEGTGKKRKRSETDDGDEKVGKKKVRPYNPIPASSIPLRRVSSCTRYSIAFHPPNSHTHFTKYLRDYFFKRLPLTGRNPPL